MLTKDTLNIIFLFSLPPPSYLAPLPPPLQAPGAEGAASPAEGGAEGTAAAQQQAAAAKRTDLPPL